MIIDREKGGLVWKFRPELKNSGQTLQKCNANEFYGGPFFDSEGNISEVKADLEKRLAAPHLQVNLSIKSLFRMD